MEESEQCRAYHDWMDALYKIHRDGTLAQRWMSIPLLRSVENKHFRDCVQPELEERRRMYEKKAQEKANPGVLKTDELTPRD